MEAISPSRAHIFSWRAVLTDSSKATFAHEELFTLIKQGNIPLLLWDVEGFFFSSLLDKVLASYAAWTHAAPGFLLLLLRTMRMWYLTMHEFSIVICAKCLRYVLWNWLGEIGWLSGIGWVKFEIGAFALRYWSMPLSCYCHISLVQVIFEITYTLTICHCDLWTLYIYCTAISCKLSSIIQLFEFYR